MCGKNWLGVVLLNFAKMKQVSDILKLGCR